MPKKLTVEPVKVIRNKLERWRVIVPKDLRDSYAGVQARYFDTQKAGDDFADELMRARKAPELAAFAVLPAHVQRALIQQVDILGLNRAHRAPEAAVLMIKNDSDDPENPAITSTVIAECLSVKTDVSKKYIADLKSTFKKFAAMFGEKRIDKISTLEIQKWVNSSGNTPASKLHHHKSIGVLFSHAEKVGKNIKPDRNPMKGVATPEAAAGEISVLTLDQCRRLLAAALETDPVMVPFFAICMFAGLRPEECKRLDNADIDLATNLIEVSRHKSKTRQRRHVEILPVLRAWLELGYDELFPKETDEKKPKPAGWIKNNFRGRFDSVRERAGLIKVLRPADAKGRWGTLAEGRYPIESIWGQDTMRHGFMSFHLAVEENAPKLALMVGHEDSDILFKHYRAIKTPDGERITKAMGKEYFSLTPKAIKAWAKAQKEGVSGQGPVKKNAL